jgi:hypothetical protein
MLIPFVFELLHIELLKDIGDELQGGDFPIHDEISNMVLGSVDLSRLNLQQSVWYLGKAEPM